MPRCKATFTETEIKRLIKAARKEGLKVVEVHRPDGTTVVLPLTRNPEIISDDDEEIIL